MKTCHSAQNAAEPLLRPTNAPYRVLFDYLEGGDTLEEFYITPSVKREQAIAVLDAAYEAVTEDAYSA